MKLTLLQIVQTVLNELIGDEVTDITDTTESAAIALIARDVYYELIDSRDWTHLRSLTKPSASADVSTPTHVAIDSTWSKIEWIKYDKQVATDSSRKKYETVNYQFPDVFIEQLNGRNSLDSTVTTVTDTNGMELLIVNNRAPIYWTSLDDVNLIFDSYNAAMDTAGTDKDKFQILAYTYPTWTESNSFIPDLPIDCFSAYVEEVKSRASVDLKGVGNQKMEQSAQRLRRRISQSANKTNNGLRYKNYGRRGVK